MNEKLNDDDKWLDADIEKIVKESMIKAKQADGILRIPGFTEAWNCHLKDLLDGQLK